MPSLWLLGQACPALKLCSCFSHEGALVLAEKALSHRHVIWGGDLDVCVGALHHIHGITQ